MGRIPRDVVDAVRDRTDLVEVVTRHVSLQRRGTSFVGLCPFHQEKTPSFHVIPAKGIFHCFGCSTGGDVFKFLMMLEGLSFVEAVKELASAAGVVVEDRELTPAEQRALKQRSTLFDVLEEAASWFERCLWTSTDGAQARAYLEDRGLDGDHIQAARLGFAPEGWTRLMDHMHRKGFAPARLAEAGLVRERKSGEGHYDAFRNRVMFPITDERGRVIAFGGRIMEGDAPKYINTPETRLYQKAHVLYGLQLARKGIQQRDRVLVVEGYFDVLSLHQAGFTEAVATCGTALTAEHLEKIRRMTRNVVLLLDADEAGLNAAERALPLFLGAGIQPWRLELPDAKDPDELVREQGTEALEAALAARQPMLRWFVHRKLGAYGQATASGTEVGAVARERVLDDVLPMLVGVEDSALVSDVARRLGIREEAFYGRLDEARRKGAAPEAEPSQPPRGWRPDRDIVHLLWLLVHRYDQVADLAARLDPRLLAAHEPVRSAVARLISGEPVAAILPDADDPGVQRTLSAIVARGELYGTDEAARALCDVANRLDRPFRQAQRAELRSSLERALATGHTEEAQRTTRRRAELVVRERKLEAALRSGEVHTCVALLSADRP